MGYFSDEYNRQNNARCGVRPVESTVMESRWTLMKLVLVAVVAFAAVYLTLLASELTKIGTVLHSIL